MKLNFFFFVLVIIFFLTRINGNEDLIDTQINPSHTKNNVEILKTLLRYYEKHPQGYIPYVGGDYFSDLSLNNCALLTINGVLFSWQKPISLPEINIAPIKEDDIFVSFKFKSRPNFDVYYEKSSYYTANSPNSIKCLFIVGNKLITYQIRHMTYDAQIYDCYADILNKVRAIAKKIHDKNPNDLDSSLIADFKSLGPYKGGIFTHNTLAISVQYFDIPEKLSQDIKNIIIFLKKSYSAPSSREINEFSGYEISHYLKSLTYLLRYAPAQDSTETPRPFNTYFYGLDDQLIGVINGPIIEKSHSVIMMRVNQFLDSCFNLEINKLSNKQLLKETHRLNTNAEKILNSVLTL